MNFDKYDSNCKVLADMSIDAFTELVQENPKQAQELFRGRYRYRLDEFASHVMAPLLSRTGIVSPPGEIDQCFYGVVPERRGKRTGIQKLVMTGRGVGKTTRQKVRAFHGLLYGLRRVSVAIAATDDDAVGWTSTLKSWSADPTDELKWLFPELKVTGNQNHLTICTRYGTGHLLARGFYGSLRGLNVDGLRPDALDLDDVEGEDKSLSEASRNANQTRIVAKILPLAPLEGGCESWWVQTPIHHDCVAVRAHKGQEDLLGWESRRIPVIRHWPKNKELWEQCRKIYFDADSYPDRVSSKNAAKEFYANNQAKMDEGADCVDPVRMGPFACYSKLWDVGATSFDREYLVITNVQGSGKLGGDKWVRFSRHGETVVCGGNSIPIRQMRLSAHLDTSDGSDDGALVVCGEFRGRYYLVGIYVYATTRLSEQLPGAARELVQWVNMGLKSLSWEPPSGSASLVRAEIVKHLVANGIGNLKIEERPSTENKNARIMNTLEPLGANGLLAIPEGMPPRLVNQIDDFDPSKNTNRDDFLDAAQRAIERLQNVDTAAQAKKLRDAIKKHW